MNMENASGVRGTPIKIFKISKRQFEVRLHGEQSIFSRMQELNDKSSILNGFIGTIHFLKDDHHLFIERVMDFVNLLRTLVQLILISSLQELTLPSQSQIQQTTQLL